VQDVSGGHSSELIGHRARECDCSGKVAPELLPVGVGASSDHRPEGTALGVAAHERLRKHLQLHSLPGGLHRPPLDQPDRPVGAARPRRPAMLSGLRPDEQMEGADGPEAAGDDHDGHGQGGVLACHADQGGADRTDGVLREAQEP